MAFLKTLLVSSVALFPQAFAAKLLVSHFSGPVYTLDLSLSSPTSGTLKVTGNYTGCGNIPTWLTLDSVSKTVWCFDEDWNGSGVITQWSADANGILTLTGSAPTPGNSVYGALYGGPDGKGFVATAEYSPSTITTYKLPITSSSKAIQTIKFTMNGTGPRPDRQDAPHPHASFTDPSGAYLIVPDLGADLVRIFSIDSTTGMLTACPAAKSLPGDGPRHGVFKVTQAGLKYYSLNEVSSSVGVYDVSYPAGGVGCLTLTRGQTISTYGVHIAGNTTEKAAEVRIFGDFLYASNRNDTTFGKEKDSIALYRIEPSGQLTFLSLENSYGYFPRPYAINNAGTYLAIGGQTTSNVAIVARNATTGKLGPLVANIDLAPRGTYGGEDGLSSVIWFE